MGDDSFEASFESSLGRFGDVLHSADLVFPRAAESSEKRDLTAADLLELKAALRRARDLAPESDAKARHALTLRLVRGGFGLIGMLFGVLVMIKKSGLPT